MASEPTLSSLALLAAASGELDSPDDPSSSTSATKAQSRKHYIRTLHKVIDESDIVILVLDARDSEGCRSRLVEEEVRRREHEGKKLVFVLNKIGTSQTYNARPFGSVLQFRLLDRSRSPSKCRSLATVPPTFNAHPSIQVFDTAATH